ncbi:MAG: NnrU family protein [Gammaproteobacteria bacterium]|nr:NnrU family protein [Gammaproteobacteria bacterium]
MSQAINIEAAGFAAENQGLFKRIAVFSYGVFAYTAGVAALLWIILAMGGLAPVGLSGIEAGSTGLAIIVDTFLITLFALQHSVMARQGFKQWLVKHIPAAAERATYMLSTGIVVATTLYFWQTLPGTVWSIDNTFAQYALWSLYALGWAYLFIATFVTNHFELMGLRQVYLFLKNKPYTSLSFTRKFMYRYSRHPMMLGFLIGMWAVPVMSITHFVLAGMLTLYIALGIFFEERDLIRNFGDTYRKYKKEIATFVPGLY